MQYSIRSYKIQNNWCSTELEHGNQGLSSLTTLTGLKKLLIFCCLLLTLISLIINSYNSSNVLNMQICFHCGYLQRI